MAELKCKECGSGDVYTTKDKKRVCRRCGHIEKIEEMKGGIEK